MGSRYISLRDNPWGMVIGIEIGLAAGNVGMPIDRRSDGKEPESDNRDKGSSWKKVRSMQFEFKTGFQFRSAGIDISINKAVIFMWIIVGWCRWSW